jgi:predicted transcriptional regulator
MQQFLRSDYIDVGILLMTLLLTAWSLVIGHHGNHTHVRRVTYVIALPLILIALSFGVRKIYLNDKDNNFQKTTMTNIEKRAEDLQEKESLLSDNLDSLSRSVVSLGNNIIAINQYVKTSADDLQKLNNLTQQTLAVFNQDTQDILEELQATHDSVDETSAKSDRV